MSIRHATKAKKEFKDEWEIESRKNINVTIGIEARVNPSKVSKNLSLNRASISESPTTAPKKPNQKNHAGKMIPETTSPNPNPTRLVIAVWKIISEE